MSEKYIPIWARVDEYKPHPKSQFVPAPSAERISEVVREYNSATVCRHCGGSEMSGAMFTTVGGDVCDDCC